MPDFNFAEGSGPRDPGKRIPRSPEASASPSPGERPSVLDKYPARDLSHLSGETPPPPPQAENAASTPTEEANTAAADDSAASAETGDATPTDGGDGHTPASHTPARGGFSGPLVAMLGIVLLLVLIAFLWHVNPFPSVREALAGLFTADSTETVTAEAASGDTDAEV
ncbi:MAG: hypothetical protein RRA94_10910, partial [Bacteroidota bacterium]|nr:hypothetical protein [Bacteroidota bacterium]